MAEGVLDSSGFQKKSLSTIIAEVKAGMQEAFPDELVFDDSSPDLQQIGVVCDQYAHIWDFLLELWNQLDPDNAQGVALDRINNGIRGIPRIQKSRTKVTCQLVGTASLSITAGSMVKASAGGPNYKLLSTVVLDGSGNGTGVFEAVEDGKFVVVAGDIDTIVTPIAGWTSAANSTDGVTGVDDETDPAYRIRGKNSIAIRGQGYDDAIFSKLMDLTGVEKVKVYHNREATTDANGLVSKGLAVFVKGGIDQDIFDVLLSKVNFGVVYVGSVTGYSNDERGVPHPVKFGRPSNVSIEVSVDVTESTDWTLGKVQAIKDSIVDYFNGIHSVAGLEAGYYIADVVRASDYYAGLSTIGGFYINTIQVRIVGDLTWLPAVVLGWDEYPIIDADDISVSHAP